MKEIIIGKEYKVERVVNENMLASVVGSGQANVLATPMMIALMENAAFCCLNEFLEDEKDETSVGTFISASHIASTPLNMKTYAVAKIVKADGRKVDFEIEAYDECGLIGKAEHSRVVVFGKRFQEKCNEKLKYNS